MNNEMFTLVEVLKAADFWYGRRDIDSCCLAENRLNHGEIPYEGWNKFKGPDTGKQKVDLKKV